jgi:heparan-alpha-glucosaminide N-acetyltransferase
MIYLFMNDFIYLGSIDLYLNLQEPSNFLRIKNQFKDIIYYPFQWLIIIFIAVTWVLFTFFLQVGNCSPGYLGPGGLSENGTHFNCTGGAANYIDRIILGNKHLYQNPTSKIIYKHLLPHDPEGLLGILTSICLAYFGVQCGHILLVLKYLY